MQDPSQGVAPPLQNHLHLLSANKYPPIAHLPPEQLFKYLLDAPMIVKQLAPMAWTYQNAPPDRSMFLEWIPNHKLNQPYASDGYVWADLETAYRQEIGGYHIELLVHSCGYRPSVDQVTSHARTRYHFVGKQPQVNAPPPDPSLWLVHYHRAEDSRIVPAGQVPMQPQVRQMLHERAILEKQGRIDRRDFMLHDRDHWPQISLPGAVQVPQPGMYGQNPMVARPGGYYPQQMGQPPAKRQRQTEPSSIPGPMDVIMDQNLEDEENTAFGDFFDHLTPREISLARYKQHHQWMEEVFSSPYASSQIVPTDLGLGLMGTLKGLTDGILEPPDLRDLRRPMERPMRPREAPPFTHLRKPQIEEFNKRVEAFMKTGQAEIERMKVEHAAKMQAWRKVSKLAKAEEKLRTAHLAAEPEADHAPRLLDLSTHGHVSDKEAVEDILKDVEETLGVHVLSIKEATMIEKGGLQEDESQTLNDVAQVDSANEQTVQANGGEHAHSLSAGDAVRSQPNLPEGQQTETKLPSGVPQRDFSSAAPPAQDDAASSANPTNPQQQRAEGDDASSDLGIGGDDLGLMDDINMDVDTAFDFDQTTPADGDTQTPLQLEQPNPQQPEKAAGQAVETTNSGTSVPLAGTGHKEEKAPEQLPSTGADALADETGEGIGEADGTSMFNDNTFEELAGFGDGDDNNDLVDFSGDLDNSAFGDAMHGMDGTPDNDTSGAGMGGVGEGS